MRRSFVGVRRLEFAGRLDGDRRRMGYFAGKIPSDLWDSGRAARGVRTGPQRALFGEILGRAPKRAALAAGDGRRVSVSDVVAEGHLSGARRRRDSTKPAQTACCS